MPQTSSQQTLASPSRMRQWTTRISFSTAGTAMEVVLRFVRTVILSRLLVPAEFGVAVAIATVIFTCELVSDIGLERFVLAKSEDLDGRTLATAHVMQLVRGLLLAGGLALAAGLVAKIFGIPEYRTSFMVVAIIMLIRSLNHLGVKQVQRDFNYRLEATAIVTAQVAALGLAVAAGYALRDHRAILVAFGVEALAFAIMTHWLAPMPYELRLDRKTGRQALAFGVPLLASGLALALTSQADRFMVGNVFGIKTLALYGVVLTMATVPLGSIYRVVSSIALPLLVRDRENPLRLEASYRLLNWGSLLLGTVYASGLALLLDVVTPMIFGGAYVVAKSMHILVAIIVLARVLRWPPTILALALGRTQRLAVTNIVSGAGLFISAGLLYFYQDLAIVLIGVLIGEIAALGLFQNIMNREDGAIGQSTLSSFGAGTVVASTIVCGLMLLPDASLANRLALAAAFLPSVVLLVWRLSRSWNDREASSPVAILRPAS